MLDIETLSTDSNGVIVSISAVEFELNTGKTGNRFEMGVDIQEQLDNGAIIDGDTVMWWLSQDKQAQKQLVRLERHPVADVLKAFNDFVESADCSGLWGNSPSFDNVMVRNLYKRHKTSFVAPFWIDKCVRTRAADMHVDKSKLSFVGTKHNGIDDCLHQIKYCIRP